MFQLTVFYCNQSNEYQRSIQTANRRFCAATVIEEFQIYIYIVKGIYIYTYMQIFQDCSKTFWRALVWDSGSLR